MSEAREGYYQRIITTRLYDALPAEARSAVSRLAISELPLPIDAVMQIAGVDQAPARSSLEAGVAFGLLQQFDEPDLPSLYHPPGLLRPWLSDPKRVPEQDASLVHRRLAAFWRSSLEAGRHAELRIPVEVELWACRAHAERGEHAATFQWATIQLARMLERRAEWIAARTLLEQIREPDRDADCLMALASVESSLGEWKAARVHLQRAHQLLPDGTSQKASTWHQLATIDLREGDYAAARVKFATALQINQAIGDRASETATSHQLATIDVLEGEYAAAREKFAQSLQIKQAIGDLAGEAATWHQLATIHLNQGDFAAAREKSAKALQILQAIGDRAGEAATWHNLGTADLREGKYAAAREKLAKALEMRQAIGDRAGEAATWHSLAVIDIRQSDYAAAREKSANSLQMRHAIGDRAGEAATWHQLASIDLNESDYAAAREKFANALEMRQAIGDRAGEAATWHQLASIDIKEGDYSAAREKFANALEMRQTIGDRAGEAAAFYQLGVLAHETGRGHLGARLVAICWLIDRAIGHGDAESDLRNLSALGSQLRYDQAQFDAMIAEARQAYQSDRGRALIERACAEEE